MTFQRKLSFFEKINGSISKEFSEIFPKAFMDAFFLIPGRFSEGVAGEIYQEIPKGS